MQTLESRSTASNQPASASSAPFADDVLHLGSSTKLTPEEIAKAVAHHNRHHPADRPQKTAARAGGKRA